MKRPAGPAPNGAAIATRPPRGSTQHFGRSRATLCRGPRAAGPGGRRKPTAHPCATPCCTVQPAIHPEPIPLHGNPDATLTLNPTGDPPQPMPVPPQPRLRHRKAPGTEPSRLPLPRSFRVPLTLLGGRRLRIAAPHTSAAAGPSQFRELTAPCAQAQPPPPPRGTSAAAEPPPDRAGSRLRRCKGADPQESAGRRHDVTAASEAAAQAHGDVHRMDGSSPSHTGPSARSTSRRPRAPRTARCTRPSAPPRPEAISA